MLIKESAKIRLNATASGPMNSNVLHCTAAAAAHVCSLLNYCFMFLCRVAGYSIRPDEGVRDDDIHGVDGLKYVKSYITACAVATSCCISDEPCHRLRSSGSTVVTMTCKVNGKTEISTSCRSETP